MPFLLCHDCYTWVEPRDGRCPECQHALDPDSPDPPLHALRTAMGTLLCRIGPVRVPRKLLPDTGTLYATTDGLCFVPHQLTYVPQAVETGGSSSLLWTLAAMIWTPLVLVAPFFRTREVREQLVPTLLPLLLTERDSPQLARMLMENPGVFFVPRRSIRLIRRRWSRWIIERADGPPLKLTPDDDPSRFRTQMAALPGFTPWQTVHIE